MKFESQPLALTKFISISLDVSGSTESKDRLAAFAKTWNLNISDLYEQFARALLNTERFFLDLLCTIKSNPDQKCAYDLDRLFLIKTIGDEWWYSYSLEDLDDFDISQHARHLFMALLAFLSKYPISISIPSTPPTHPDGLDDPEDMLMLELPLKITCDLIHGFDIGKGRESAISPVIATCTGKKLVRAGDTEYMRMMSHLGAVTMVTNPQSGKVMSINRSDFVGMEVDRFFRITGKSQTGRILVGKQLLDALEFEDLPAQDIVLEQGWKCVLLRERFRGGDFSTLQTHIFVHFENEDGYKLKGIQDKYQAAICTDRHSLSGASVWTPTL